jgi:hypothetical protein
LITEYNLYPGHRVFVDGQNDFYEQDFEQKYFEVMEVNYDWEQSLNRYKVDTIVLSTKTAWGSTTKESRRWRTVYGDKIAIVFRAIAEQAAESQQFSAGSPGGKNHDLEITKEVPGDQKIVAVKQQKGV